MPEPAWADTFSKIVDALANRFSTPRFEPHLTLLDGRPHDVQALTRHIASIAPTAAPLAAGVLDVATSDAYFRSFYALFELAQPLVDLRDRIHAAVLGTRSDDFMPHVSLLYGPVEAGPKAAAASECRDQLKGQRVGFDRIAIVRSGGDVPIERWGEVAAFRLGA